MRLQTKTWLWPGVLLLLLLGGYLWWRAAEAPVAPAAKAATRHAMPLIPVAKSTLPVPFRLAGSSSNTVTKVSPRLQYRLSNTSQTVGQLARNDKAVLLENALIDTAAGLSLNIPQNLRASGDPGSYIVQACGPVNAAFRAALQAAGATIVSYIPNNAYLVTAQNDLRQSSALPSCATVLAFEPYFKLKSDVLRMAVNPPPGETMVNLLLFPGQRDATVGQLQQLGAPVVAEEKSLIGTVLTVQLPATKLPALAGLKGVHEVELNRQRQPVNDLTRVRLGVSPDTITNSSYLGLTGTNILVNVNDTGVDATHPDLLSRVFGDAAVLTDVIGHGTHVAGIIASSGGESSTVTNASGSINPGTNSQYRGKAPLTSLFVQNMNRASSDLQQNAAMTNALISNNSWGYPGSYDYGLQSASYDAAVRDSLPGVTGSQPLVYVFAAGNDGGGDTDGLGGSGSTIVEPASAKNVISVGSVESYRNIISTNPPFIINGVTNQNYLVPQTDSSNQVAYDSSRGNVGVGIEGDYGRFKPDVVAPGSWVVSTRSQQWDMNAYYNPTNYYHITETNQSIAGKGEVDYWDILPPNYVQATIDLRANKFTTLPLNLALYANQSDVPALTPANFIGTNHAVLTPPTWQSNLDLFYSVGNPSSKANSYDITLTIAVTNDVGNYYTVLSNLNNGLGPYYRYESGTSMAAPAVSGVLALMEDFFINRCHVTNSPALMKALVINGARSLNSDVYDFQVNNTVNYQGWGLVNLPNSLPGTLSNITSQAVGSVAPMFVIDQSPTNALATGQQITYNVKVDSTAQNQPLRVTLVWTDPPGDPAAGIKLVNDLDLVVTNLDDPANPVVYFGNDISANRQFNLPWDTNTAPNVDVINNVENVYLTGPVGTNFSITVIGHHVNVNAVTAHPNDVVQDFALVISSGDGAINNALTYVAKPVSPPPTVTLPLLTVATNASGSVSNGVFLMGQHVGANAPLLGTNVVQISSSNVVVGMTNQWHFYVFTNDTTFTNVAFVTFMPPDLSIPREGVFESDLNNATRIEADIDLYVSQNGALTNLDPAVLSNCVRNAGTDRSSLSRGGTEYVTYSNSGANNVYYIGVQSQDEMAAEYAFFGIATLLPFDQRDQNGNPLVQLLPVPQAIPDGTPAHPGTANYIGVSTISTPVRRVVVTNSITHEYMGDLFGLLKHGTAFAVLNNHNVGNGQTNQTFIYDDSGQGDIPGSQSSDGPGSLQNFIASDGIGVWQLIMQDNTATHTGRVNSAYLDISPQEDTNNGVNFTLPPGGVFYDFVDVPADATNLTISVSGITQPVAVYVRRDAIPDLVNTNLNDANAIFVPAGGQISINRYSNPPLNAGIYYIAIQNIGTTSTGGRLTFRLDLNITGVTPVYFIPTNAVPLLDDAITNGVLNVANTNRIVSAEVGVRIDHPRESDLALTLVSPIGTRVLLAENRGGTDTNGYGSTINITNVYPRASSGNYLPDVNTIDTSLTAGILRIDYNMFTIPDRMVVIYNGQTNLDTGLVSGINTVFVPFGPGPTTLVTIIMNPGTNDNTGTAWNYTASVAQQFYNYFTFTEDTNKTTTPIKFYPPPFQGTLGSNVLFSGFEGVTSTNYISSVVVDGWTVASNLVTVMTQTTNVLTETSGSNSYSVTVVSDAANTGANFLALGDGTITRTLPTVQGRKYALSYAYQNAGLNPVSWWRGDSNVVDSIGGNNGSASNSLTFATGEVSQAFVFNGSNNWIQVADAANLHFANAMTVEAWIYPYSVGDTTNEIISKWGGGVGNQRSFTFNLQSTADASPYKGAFAVSRDGNAGGSVQPVYSTTSISANQWTHVAGVYDGVNLKFYVNGQLDATTPWANGIFAGTAPLVIGATLTSASTASSFFNGLIDEPAVYNRALSADQIQAIYLAGTNGLCGTPTPPTMCAPAVAQVTLAGVSTNTLIVTNTSWRMNSQSFTAPANGTPFQFQGQQAGMLLDSIQLIDLGSGGYALPEQTLDVLKGEYANGTGHSGDIGNWQLEVWDNRVGAFLSTGNKLLSWQLSFIYENGLATNSPNTNTVTLTSAVPNILFNELTTLTVTNTATDSVPTNTITYTLIVTNNTDGSIVTNASISTNGIITWTPDESQGPGAYTFTTIATDNTGASATNSFSAYVYEVNTPPVPPVIPDQTVNVGNQLVVTNTATDADIPTNTLTYALLTSPPGMVIDPNTGIISWTPIASNVGTNIVSVQVTDLNTNAINAQNLSATNSFNVIVPAGPLITGVTVVPATGVTLGWSSVTNQQFQVQWATNLTPTIVWNRFTNIIGSTSGAFTFTDDLTQDGGTNAPHFYRLLQYP